MSLNLPRICVPKKISYEKLVHAFTLEGSTLVFKQPHLKMPRDGRTPPFLHHNHKPQPLAQAPQRNIGHVQKTSSARPRQRCVVICRGESSNEQGHSPPRQFETRHRTSKVRSTNHNLTTTTTTNPCCCTHFRHPRFCATLLSPASARFSSPSPPPPSSCRHRTSPRSTCGRRSRRRARRS